MAGNIKGITIELNGDSTKLTSAIDGVKRQSIGLQSELKEIDKLLKFSPGNADLIAQKQQNLGRQITATAQKLDVLKQAQQQVEAQFAAGTLSEEKYNAFQREVINTEMALKNYKVQLETVNASQQELQSKTKQLETLFQAAGTSVDHYADAIGVKLLQAIKSGTASSAQLDQAIAKIGQEALGSEVDIERMRQALSRIDDGSSLDEVRQDLNRIEQEANQAESEVNSFGDTIKDVVAGLATGGGIAAVVSQALDVSSLNTKIDITLEVPEESKASVREAIKGVEAYGVDAEAALQGVQRQWALNKDASDATNSAIIDQAGTIASAYAGIDFNELIQESYEMGKSMGISQEEALGLTNALLKTGFPAEQLDIISEYGTQLKNAGYNAEEIQAIMSAGVETGTWNIDNLLDGLKEGRIKIAEFGQEVPKATKELLSGTDISAKQLQKWGQDVAKGGKTGSKAMTEVAKALVGVEDETQRNALGVALFGTMYEDQGKNITDTLINASKETVNLKDNQEDLNSSVEKMKADPAVLMKQAMADIQTAVAPLLASIAEIVGSIAKWISQNSALAAVIAAVVTGVGLVVGIFMALAPVVMTISTIIGGVGAAFGAMILPVLGIVAAVAAFVALGVAAYKNWDGISEFFVGLWESVKTIFMTSITAIGLFLSTIWGGMVTAIKVVWDGIKLYFTTVFNIYKLIFTTAWNVIKTVVTTVWNGLKTAAMAVFNGIKIYFTTVLNIYKTIFTTVWNVIKAVVTTVWNGLKTAAMAVFNGIKTYLTTVLNIYKTIFTTVWNVIKKVVTTIWNGLKTTATTVFNAIKTTITTVFNGIKSVATSVWNVIKSVITTAVNGIKSVITTVFNAVRTVVTTVMNTIKSVISTAWNGAKSIVTSVVNGIKSVVSNVFNGMKTVVSTAMNSVKTAIVNGWNGAKSFLSGISLTSIGKNIIQGLINGIKSMGGSVTGAIKGIADGAVNAAKKALGIHSPSRVMRDKVGYWVSEGLAKGIKANKNSEKAAKEKAQVIVKTYKSKLKDLDTKYSSGMIDTSKYVKSLKTLKGTYGSISGATTQINSKISKANTKKAIATQKKRQAEQRKLATKFNTKMTNLSNKNGAGILSNKQYVKQLQKMKSQYKNVTNAVSKIDLKIANVKKADVKTLFKRDKDRYAAKKKDSKASMQSELDLLRRSAKHYKKNSDERIYFENLAKQKQQEITEKKKKINDDYYSKVTKLEEDYTSKYQELTNKYTDAVAAREDAIKNFAGIFDEVKTEDVSGEQLVANLQSQTDVLAEWRNNLDVLSSRGIDKGLLEELQQLGPQYASQIAALTTLSNGELDNYTDLWKEKSELAHKQSVEELEGLRLDTASQIAALQSETGAKLLQYQNEWKKAMSNVKKATSSELSAMKNVGGNAVQGLIDGMKQKKSDLKKIAKELADIVSGTTKKTLDIHSPSRVMKKLGVFTNEGFIEGLKSSAGRLQMAMQGAYGSLADNAQQVSANSAPVSTTTSNNYTTTQEFGGVTVEQLVVREEADIQKISRQLFQYQQRTARGRGM